jgi:VWFA-related protein
MLNSRRLATPTSLLLVCALLAPAHGQQPSPEQTPAPQPTTRPETPPPARPATQTTPPAPQADDVAGDVVRITSNLVQFDAVVYDKENRPVTDLRPEEFEVTVGGKRQEITNFSYVSVEAGTPTAKPPAASAANPSAPPVPPARLRPEQVRRTIALVVDDLGVSFEGMYYVRRSLKKFVDEQMQPGDLVAVLRTSAGVGALQQFTSDKRILHKAIELVRWYPRGRGGVTAFAPLEADPLARARREAGADDLPGDAGGGGRFDSAEDFREEVFAVGTLGALNFIVRGMGELPGRKSVVMFSDGFELYSSSDPFKSERVLNSLRRLSDLANRAAVVVYTVDARGLATLGLTAADSTAGLDPVQLERQLSDRRARFFNTQDGLRYLAEQTGGVFTRNTNDLSEGIRRALEDQKGYYLIGFRPDAEIFDAERGRARYNRFQVKVARAGVRVRTRGGFYGFTDDEARPVRRTAAEQMVAAITSPFASGELGLSLTALFSSGPKKDSMLESVLHLDAKRFTVEDDAGEWKRLVFDVFAVTVGENGQVVNELSRVERVRMRGDALRHVMEHGLIYRMQVPLKKPGAYQLRVAVRDTASERVGSASQYVEVPDLRKNRLALSSLLMTSSLDAAAGADAPALDPARDIAVRRFRQGSQVDYAYYIYNAKLDKASARPQLRTQVRLFRDGQSIFEGRLAQFDPTGQTDMNRLQAAGRLNLGTDLAPGEYVLQVVVTDALAGPKHAVASQWIEFEIVK